MKKMAKAPTIAKAEVPDLGSMLESLAREGAQRILQVALRLEAAEYVEAHAGETVC